MPGSDGKVDPDEQAVFEELMEEYKTENAIYETMIQETARQRVRMQTDVLPAVFSDILKQCTREMREVLRASTVYETMNETNDIFTLLRLIRESTAVVQRRKEPAVSVHAALTQFVEFRQHSRGRTLTNEEYHQGFLDRVKAYELISGGMLGTDPKRVKEYYEGAVPFHQVAADDPS